RRWHKNWGRSTECIRLRSRPGKDSWWRKRRRFSPEAAFTTRRRSNKKRRSCISRSESCRWNWTGCKKSRGSCDAEGETRMHRVGSANVEHQAAVRADGTTTLELVLRTTAGDGRELAFDAAVGRAIHAHAILRDSAYGSCAGRARLEGQSQARAAGDAKDGDRGDAAQSAC